MTLKVIGAGFPRTGTLSTKAALELLGYPCYHMKVVMTDADHLDKWYRFETAGTAIDWHVLFDNYRATVDAPCCHYYRELLAAFPDAKVLLNVRDPDRWYDSLVTLYRTSQAFKPLSLILPRLKKFLRFGDTLMPKLLQADWRDRDACIRRFNAHIEEVRATVPEDQLLIFRVSDGWEPLCRFLGHEVPHNTPFPHLNEGGETVRSLMRRVSWGRSAH